MIKTKKGHYNQMDIEKKVLDFAFMKRDLDEATKDYFKSLLTKHPRIELVEEFDLQKVVNIKRLNDYWYSGPIASIKIKDYLFEIETSGEQRYSLYIRDLEKFDKFYKDKLPLYKYETFKNLFEQNEPIETYVNKSQSSNSFFDAFGCYFATDKELNELIDLSEGIFVLECGNNNWLEMSCQDTKTGKAIWLTDIFMGMDVGFNILEDITSILDDSDSLIQLYDGLLNLDTVKV